MGAAASTTILFASASTLKKMAAVSGDKDFTCFKAPSRAYNSQVKSKFTIASIITHVLYLAV